MCNWNYIPIMGFSPDRFVKEVEKPYFCELCQKVAQKPKIVDGPEIDCGHIFCEECVVSAIQNSDSGDNFICPGDKSVIFKDNVIPTIPFFEKLYSKLIIRCSFHDKCKTTLPIVDIEQHEVDCDHNDANFIICDKRKSFLLYPLLFLF